MKAKYFERIENKYVFNLSRIFWHIIILIGTLAIVVGVVFLLYGIIPAGQKSVEKLPPPAKPNYPNPITVTLADLKLDEAKPVKPVQEIKQAEEAISEVTNEPSKSTDPYEIEYQNAVKALRKLWPAKGHYEFVGNNGQRLYEFTHSEKYRKFVEDISITGMLDELFSRSKINSFKEKKQMVDLFSTELGKLPENKRGNTFQIITGFTIPNIQEYQGFLQSVLQVFPKIQDEEQDYYLQRAFRLIKKNSSLADSKAFIDYIFKIIDKFDPKQHARVFNVMYDSYMQYLNNVSILTEQTDLFIAMLPKIKPELQSQALDKYFLVYVQKNANREQTISQIDQKYADTLAKIEEKFMMDKNEAESKYITDKAKKSEYRLKGLIGFGSGIGIVALIAIILVFLSIQRIVNRIDEKLSKETVVESQSQ